MNKNLTKAIIEHIFYNLKIIPSIFVDNKSFSIMNNKYLLKNKLIFGQDENIIENDIWGCELVGNNFHMKIILGNCKQDSDFEYALLIQLKNSPSYGCYINLSKNDSECMIACNTSKKDWIECNLYLQATFLAGMEQIKDFYTTHKQISNYEEEYKLLISFIKYYEDI